MNGPLHFKRFWLRPDGVKVHVGQHHYVEAKKHFDTLSSCEAVEALLQRSWLRCSIVGSDLFYERRKALSLTQRRELKNLAIEQALVVYDDTGRQMI